VASKAALIGYRVAHSALRRAHEAGEAAAISEGDW